MAQLDYGQAHNYVQSQQKKGRDTFWDGWDIVIFRPTRAGYFHKEGAFRNGRWGRVRRVSPDGNGIWNI